MSNVDKLSGGGGDARGPRAGSREPATPRTPCIVAGLLRDQPELTLLTKAASGLARIELVDDRLTLVSNVVALRPVALVLPAFDAARVSTAPLVLRLRREVPTVTVILLACQPSGAGQPILRALQAGAHVLAAGTPRDLAEVLAGLLRAREGNP